MLLWTGLVLLLLGLFCFAIDRRAALYFYTEIGRPFRRFIIKTTDFAKGAHWLAISCGAILISQVALAMNFQPAIFHALFIYALAFLACLAAGSAVIHTLKLALCRMRPRDDFEFGFYGFRPFSFQWQYDSFPSGHSLTIMCVAVIASCAFPQLAILWFAVALWLSLTRALLTSHFLSDCFIGAGIGLLASREVLEWFFPALMQPWF